MNEEFYKAYQQALEHGDRQKASGSIRAFIDSFDEESQRATWTRQFLESRAYGHKIRHEIYQDIIFPELHRGYLRREPWSLYFLARTSANLRDAQHLFEKVDRLTARSFMELCYEAEPGFRDVRSDLLKSIVGTLEFAIHEWPIGLCVEFDEIEREITFGRRLDSENTHTKLFEEVAHDLAEAKERFHLSTHQACSVTLQVSRPVWLRPAIQSKSKDCFLFLDGELYSQRVNAVQVLHAAQVLRRLPPVTCVYLPNTSAAGRHVDYTCNEAFADFLAREMPSWIEREAGRFERVFLCGLSLSALQAVFTALRHPGVFAGVLAQSPSAWWQEEWLTQSLTPAGITPNRFWLSVGTQERQTNVSHPPTPLVQTTSQLDSVRRLSAALKAAGHDIHLNEYDGGHDPTCWAAELPSALAWLFNQP